METFIAVLRSVHRETEERHDHLDIFREFLDHLGRSVRRSDHSKPADRRVVQR
jgi:hypothetical protein